MRCTGALLNEVLFAGGSWPTCKNSIESVVSSPSNISAKVCAMRSRDFFDCNLSTWPCNKVWLKVTYSVCLHSSLHLYMDNSFTCTNFASQSDIFKIMVM